MPIVHDPKTGQFTATSGGGKLAGKSVEALQAHQKKLRLRLFTAKPGSAQHRRLTNELKRTEEHARATEAASARLKNVRQKLFTAKPGSASHKQLSAEAKQHESFLQGGR